MSKKTYRAVQVARPNGPLEIVEREIVDPGPGQVRVRVHACGLCHGDVLTVMGAYPGIQLPRVPGHEIAGVIDAIGDGVAEWKPGQRVGVGWFGGSCGHCQSCRRGDFLTCPNGAISGIHFDGGYAEFVIVPAAALALIPEDLSDVEAGPLMCAGMTTFNALRNSGARAGDLVAIHGIGGLGHLGVQFAARMGFRTVAIARGQDKAALAKKLGAHLYIDSTTQDPAAELTRLGGARVILATVTNGKAMSSVIPGLGINGKLVIVGVSMDPVEISPMLMVGGRRSVSGWPSGTSIDSEDAMNFSVLAGVRPMIEEYPLEKAAEAYERMMSGQARFRVVLRMEAAK
ncbi:MAG TPA: alcohol dehydrogenase [Acidisarcina sp.]|nr:alcohol dehydrogenase [Acidisarcina sp.]